MGSKLKFFKILAKLSTAGPKVTMVDTTNVQEEKYLSTVYFGHVHTI